jgi:hypothetical protein
MALGGGGLPHPSNLLKVISKLKEEGISNININKLKVFFKNKLFFYPECYRAEHFLYKCVKMLFIPIHSCSLSATSEKGREMLEDNAFYDEDSSVLADGKCPHTYSCSHNEGMLTIAFVDLVDVRG